jgi:translation initiation factor 4G
MNAISDASSTCARSSCSTPGSFVDVSSTPSEPDETHEEEDDAQFSISDLMKWRLNGSRSEQSESRLSACHVPDCLMSVPESPQHSSDREGALLMPSTNSWAANQATRRNRFQRNVLDSSDEEIVRKMKSILNKLTVEKFPTLSKQLVHCGIRTTAHLEVLVHEIFAKATTQHHFINMYADLCTVLHAHFSDMNANNDPNLNIKRVLLNACQASFEKHLTNLAPLQTLDSEEESQLYKLQMIGNIKFVGALLLRKMLASKVMYYIVAELLSQPYLPEALECFVAFLTVVGPGFDHPRHEGLSEVFDRAMALSNDPRVKPRIRWLLKDVLDLRACGWQDLSPKQREGPSTLEEVAQKFHAEAQTKTPSQSEWRAPQDTADWNDKHGKRQTNVSDDSFDKALMHKELASTFGELLVSGDVRKAICRIASINVPAEVQAEQTCDLLQFMSEMPIDSIRTLGFKFIVTVFTERYWMPSAFEDGFHNFAGLCLDGKVKAPELEKVIHDEMIPAFQPAVNRGMLSAFTIQDLLHRLARM